MPSFTETSRVLTFYWINSLSLKLGDFGLARQVSTGSGLYTHCTVSAVHGTSVYLPNEYLRQKILSPAVDVYSYGIVFLLEMSTGKASLRWKTTSHTFGRRRDQKCRQKTDQKITQNYSTNEWLISLNRKIGSNVSSIWAESVPTIQRQRDPQWSRCSNIIVSLRQANGSVDWALRQTIIKMMSVFLNPILRHRSNCSSGMIWSAKLKAVPQTDNFCPPIVNIQNVTEENVDNDSNDDDSTDIHSVFLIYPNTEGTAQTSDQQTVCNNDMSSALIPLITELGVSNDKHDSK